MLLGACRLSARRPRTPVLLVLALTLLLTGCSLLPQGGRGPAGDKPERAAAELATGLADKNLTSVEFAGTAGADVDASFKPLVSGMGPVSPTVSVLSVRRDGRTATATLAFSWTFPGIDQAWAYETSASLVEDGGRWRSRWQPSIVFDRLDDTNRLSQSRLSPARGELLGESGDPIVVGRPVVRIGLDKAAMRAEQLQSSALRLAELVDVDGEAYAKRVATAGPAAFVEALVLRRDAAGLPRGDDIRAIPGALSIQDTRMLAPTRDFARALIGTVGEATKEIVDASDGAVVAGDQVGLTGLQHRYDDVLRGTPGVRVRLVALKQPSPSPTPGPAPTVSPSPTPEPVTLFERAALAGKPLLTTLNVGLQELAETTLGKTRPASAIVAIRPSSGAILAAANGPGSKSEALATAGQAAPGSTFKVVSSLALLRAGLTPETSVSCPATVTVDGRRFRNYSDYPSGNIGSITLRQALAQSCNTAFIGQRGAIGRGALAAAAGSLGLGLDYDVGFPAYFGAVPADPRGTAEAAALIGQGTVQASPLALAAVAASVSAGHTVVPHLVDGVQPDPTAKPLTPAEATRLRDLMRSVVTDGSGRGLSGLRGPAVIAKTGTAEYGSANPLKTHAWMIAAQGDLAVAVFVNDGQSGSRTAGPLLKAFLHGAG